MNDNIELTSGQEGYIEYKSASPFEFFHILKLGSLSLLKDQENQPQND